MRNVLAAILLIVMSLPALAYTPHVGDRAQDIHGRDVISDSVVHLEDYAGQWIFIDFWASWCGPCMRELPNMLAETMPYRERGDLVLFSVSLDQPSTDARMNKAISDFDIDYPVIYDGNGWQSVQGQEWDIHSIPATFLVDPQGNIVATNLRGDRLGPALDFLLNHHGIYSPIGVRSSQVVNDDQSVDVTLELYNPRRTPMRVEVDYYYIRYIYAEDDPEHQNRPVSREYVQPNEDGPELEFTVAFSDFGDTVHGFTIPAEADTDMLYYYVNVMLPGTRSLMDGEGLWVTERGRVRFEE
jgi:thiol-disulfide isomerase/thioredoxin